MRALAIAVVLVLLCGCQVVAAGSRPGLIEWLFDVDTARTLARQQNKPVMIYFYTDWCSWCTKLDTETYADPRVAAAAENFICVKMNGGKHKALVREFGVRGYPTIAFLKPDGTQIDMFPGFQPPDRFLELLSDMLRRSGR